MPDPTPTATDRETEARAIACPEYGCGAKHHYGCDRLTERLIRLIAAAQAQVAALTALCNDWEAIFDHALTCEDCTFAEPCAALQARITKARHTRPPAAAPPPASASDPKEAK